MGVNYPKFKQSFKVDYKTYNEGRVIKAIAHPQLGDKFGACRFYDEKECFSENSLYVTPIDAQLILGYGMAKFKEDDKINIELGKEIARKKAIRNWYKNYYNYSSNIYKKMFKELERKITYIESLKNNISKLNDEIIELTKEDNN